MYEKNTVDFYYEAVVNTPEKLENLLHRWLMKIGWTSPIQYVDTKVDGDRDTHILEIYTSMPARMTDMRYGYDEELKEMLRTEYPGRTWELKIYNAVGTTIVPQKKRWFRA